MKKLTICLLLWVLLLTGCAQTPEATTQPLPVAATQESTAEPTTQPTAEATEAPTAQPATTSLPWAEPYADALAAFVGDDEVLDNMPNYVYLTDLDFDGTPEMILSELGASNSWVIGGFTSKDGAAVPLVIEDIPLYNLPKLYKDDATGELVWLHETQMRDGPTFYYYSLLRLRLQDGTVHTEELLAWNLQYDSAGETTHCTLTTGGNETPTTEEEVNLALAAQYNGLRELANEGISCSVNDIMVPDSGYHLRSSNLDKEAFLAFCTTWTPIIETP